VYTGVSAERGRGARTIGTSLLPPEKKRVGAALRQTDPGLLNRLIFGRSTSGEHLRGFLSGGGWPSSKRLLHKEWDRGLVLRRPRLAVPWSLRHHPPTYGGTRMGAEKEETPAGTFRSPSGGRPKRKRIEPPSSVGVTRSTSSLRGDKVRPVLHLAHGGWFLP